MITPLLLALALLQDETLLERLGSEQAAERGAAQQQLIRLGRGAYPLLRKALASEDVELKARARETAYAIGFDPDSHRPWEEVWAAYHQAPDAPTRRVLVRLSATVRDPRLTLLAKMERGVFRELPSCPSEKAPRPPSPGAPEWDVLEEVLQAALDEQDPELNANLKTLDSDQGEPFSAEWLWGYRERGWTLYRWGLDLLQHRAPWKDVAAAWRCHLRLCPQSWHGIRLRGYIEKLEQAAADELPFLPDEKIALLAPAAQADYWASRLVEARALDWRGRTCFCDGFLEKDAVADALLALGRTAIPALLQRLGQSRLTRMVEIEHSSHSIDLRPWTVHEAAEHLLRKIVGFYAGRSNEPEKAAGGWWAWWSRAREQDEKTWWREWIEGDGDRSRSGALHRLVEADGDQAAPWVLIALEKGESFDLFDVLQAARQIPSEAVVPSLRALLHRQSRDAFIVAETADALAQHGDASGLDHLRAEVLRVRDGASDAWAMKQYLQALAGSGREEDFALALETACGESSSTESRRGAFEALSWATSLGHLANKPIATPELFHQAGSVVAGRLGDRRPSGDYSLPRFCDQAASLLRQWFPGKAVFKYDAPAPERNRQIREMQKWAEGFFD